MFARFDRFSDLIDDGIDEVLLTYDEGRGKRGKPGWEAADAAMRHIMEDLVARHPRVSIRPVEYDEEARRRVRSYFCARGEIPLYDFRGAPFYQYFHGLHASRNGFTVAEGAGLPGALTARQDGTPLFAPSLEGGALAGISAIVEAGELVELAGRLLADPALLSRQVEIA